MQKFIQATLCILLTAVLCLTPALAQETQQDRLRAARIRDYDAPIHQQPTEWLIAQFKDTHTREGHAITAARLMRNIIWQQRQLHVQGKVPPIHGNIRTFWYSHIKPALSRTGVLSDTDYKDMIKTFVHLVKDLDLMRYKDFGFTDENQHFRKIGKNHHIILFAEKSGAFSFLEDMHKKYSITVAALGGQPSVMSAEYFVDELKAKGIDIRQKFHLFTLVDYDTSGWIIRDAFLDDIQFYGLGRIEVQDLILPSLLDPQTRALQKFPLPDSPTMAEKNRKWMAQTNGIDGELFGLESEAIPQETVEKLLAAKIKDLLGKSK